MVRPITGMQHSEHSEYLQTTDIQPDSSLKSSNNMILGSFLMKNSKKALNTLWLVQELKFSWVM